MQTADEINQSSEVSYFINQPVSIFRTYNISLEQFNNWNFNGTFLGSGGHFSFSAEFRNQWRAEANVIYHSGAYDTKILRGGSDMLMPSGIMVFGSLQTDQSRKVTANIELSRESRSNSSALLYGIQAGLSARLFSRLKIGVTGDYQNNHDQLQYITTSDTWMTGRRYILGTIDQHTLGLTFRADLNLSPEFSVQYYGSPFISQGSYSGLKRIINPGASSYSDRFALYENPVLNGDVYLLQDFDSDGLLATYEISDPDFNFHQFRSNLVAKWEYRLGSFIYFVWSSDRTGSNKASSAPVGESYSYMWNVFPRNIFLIKLSYWFSL